MAQALPDDRPMSFATDMTRQQLFSFPSHTNTRASTVIGSDYVQRTRGIDFYCIVRYTEAGTYDYHTWVRLGANRCTSSFLSLIYTKYVYDKRRIFRIIEYIPFSQYYSPIPYTPYFTE